MAKKHWIYIKRGLSEDPKHRVQMGECIWLYMHIVDRADWESGIAYDWKDEQEAIEMSMPVRTLREQRRKLDDLGYISCVQLKHGQNIIIKRWINPRDYSGKMLNTDDFEGDIETEPLEIKGDTKGYIKGDTKGSSQDVTPTSNSKKSKSKSNKAATPQPPEIQLFREVVRHYPKTAQRDLVIDSIQKISARLGRDCSAADLAPFWSAWAKVSGNEWSLVWLDWAVSGQVPQRQQGGFINKATAAAQKTNDVISSWLEKKQAEVWNG